MVIVFAAQLADTPAGSPMGVPMPVAPVVVCVIAVSAVPIQRVGVEEGPRGRGDGDGTVAFNVHSHLLKIPCN